MAKPTKGKLILLPRKDAVPLQVIRGKNECRHAERHVDADARRIYCAGCKIELDPIAVLVELAGDGTMLAFVRNQLKRVQADVEAFSARRTRLRGQLRRLREEIRELKPDG
jgi:hypothetical protein